MKIEVKNVTKEFKNIAVVNNVNCVFETGKIYGIVGRNGSGKSVFLKMLCAFYIPNSGEILQDKINYIKQNSFPKDTRALIERPDFVPELTGFENLKLLASIQNKITDEDINNTLKKVCLFEEKDKKFGNYSLGMKQKLGIAQVLMENPHFIILDEPFNGIEESTVIKIKKLLKEIKKDKIIIITSHIKDDIYELADVIYKFDCGIMEKLNDKRVKK